MLPETYALRKGDQIATGIGREYVFCNIFKQSQSDLCKV